MNNVYQSVKIGSKRKVMQRGEKKQRSEKGTKFQRCIRRKWRKEWKTAMRSKFWKRENGKFPPFFKT